MLFELIASGLLAYGVAYGGVNANNDYRSNINSSYTEVSLIENDIFNINGYTIYGTYNLRDVYVWGADDFTEDFYETLTFDSEHLLIYPIVGSGADKLAFIDHLDVAYDSSSDYFDFTFYCYDPNEFFSITYSSTEIYNGTRIGNVEDSDVYYLRELYFNISKAITLNPNTYKIFDFLFTRNDNSFVVTYNGYYNFLNNALISNTKFPNILGSIVFNNSLTFAMGFYTEDISTSQYVNWVETLVYDVSTSNNAMAYYRFADVRSNPNIFFNGVKMSVDVYNTLSSVGVFSYIRDTAYDDVTFHDLLFTIMDVPVYFITRFFNFELFGMNLAVAFAGLVTLAVMLFIIRIIWRLN